MHPSNTGLEHKDLFRKRLLLRHTSYLLYLESRFDSINCSLDMTDFPKMLAFSIWLSSGEKRKDGINK